MKKHVISENEQEKLINEVKILKQLVILTIKNLNSIKRTIQILLKFLNFIKMMNIFIL